MSDRTTETYEEFDPDIAPARGSGPQTRVLWGRLAVLALLLIVAFLAGRATAGGGGNDAKIAALQNSLSQAEQENSTLQSQLNAAESSAPGDSGGSTSEPTSSPTGSEAESTTYTIKTGDTLTTIAAKFYGDDSLDDFLAEANGITDPTKIFVGQEITIPPAPSTSP